MAVSATGGTRFYIGPVTNIDTLETLSDEDAVTFFEGLSWTEVREIDSYGELGDASDAATFASVNRRRVRKLKTTRDAGTMALVVARDVRQAGQIALIAAEKTDYDYAFKVVYSDAQDDEQTDSVEYFAGMVLSRTANIGGAGDVTKRTFNIAVNSAVYEVPSDELAVPTVLVLPSIIGSSLEQGVVLTAVEGVWTGDPTSYTYQWQADTSGNGSFSNISAATAKTHTIAAGQSGDAIRVQVTAVNGAGSSSAANSLPVGLAGS